LGYFSESASVIVVSSLLPNSEGAMCTTSVRRAAQDG
jgi:hypothetical protein